MELQWCGVCYTLVTAWIYGWFVVHPSHCMGLQVVCGTPLSLHVAAGVVSLSYICRFSEVLGAAAVQTPFQRLGETPGCGLGRPKDVGHLSAVRLTAFSLLQCGPRRSQQFVSLALMFHNSALFFLPLPCFSVITFASFSTLLSPL